MKIPIDAFDSTLPKAKLWGNEDMHQFQGFWFPTQLLQGTREVLTHFKPLPNDVILASFPKTGTTWLKSLLYTILNRSSKDRLITNHPHELVPMLELQVYGPVSQSPQHFPNELSSTRIFNTHLPYQIFGKTLNSSDCRVVYITRNPKDTLVSLWHFVNSMDFVQGNPWPLEDCVEKFCQGEVLFGPYYDHVLGYQKESMEKPKKIFFITYEELKSDPKTHVKRLAMFLGCPFEGEGLEEEVEEVVRSCSIEAMKKLEVNKSSDMPNWSRVTYKSFFRKGQVGDHKNNLTKEMMERVDATTSEKFHGSSIGEKIGYGDKPHQR